MRESQILMSLVLISIFLLGLTVYLGRNHRDNPYFMVTDMVQCKANICNAVLSMDDITILVSYDSTKVHIGDKLYLVK